MEPLDRKPFPVTPGNRRVVDATRRLIEELVASTVGDDAYFRAAAFVEQAVAEVISPASEREYLRVTEGSITGAIPYSAVSGVLHPIAPPIIVSVERRDADDPLSDVVVGTVSYGFAYEGPPGSVHGGFIAAGFDALLGYAQIASGVVRLTAELDITYRSPAPLKTELRYTTWIDRVEGRKMWAAGTLHHGDVLCTEATALFIAPRAERYDELLEGRANLPA